MPGLLIKNVPAPLAKRLKALAAKHRRSMMQEALLLLEDAIAANESQGEWPAPYKGHFPMTGTFVNHAKESGRA